MIEEINLRRLRIPLAEPYKLAFGPVTHFDTVLVRLARAGHTGLGEATLLNGYTDETIEEAWRAIETVAAGLVGLGIEAAQARLNADLAAMPFARTALMTAIEMAQAHPVLDLSDRKPVPLLAGINATEPSAIAAEMDRAIARGYGTLKIKAGFDLAADLVRIRFIQRHNAGRARLRIDANQGYTPAEGCRLARELDPDSIELLEQPCAAADWKASAEIAKITAVPLMLDESIYSLDDIRRAADLGASFVKLKLMKMGSLSTLVEGLTLIRALGMEPVLGNGVASDIGCWMEACVAQQQITNAGEMNGFLRQGTPLAVPAMAVERGALRLPASPPQLDPARLEAVTVDQFVFLGSRTVLRGAS